MMLLFRPFACLIPLLLAATSYGAQTDCMDVSYYFKPAVSNQILPLDSVPTRKGKGIGVPMPFDPKKGVWYDLPKEKPKTPVKIVRSEFNEAFTWKKHDGKLNLRAPLRKIDVQRKIIIDGYPIWIGKHRQNKIEYYLEMSCKFTKKEPAPQRIKQNKGFEWHPFQFDAPKCAFAAGVDKSNFPKPFYIGLVTYQRKTFIAKIIPGISWLLVVLDNGDPTYISYARDIKILCAKDPRHVYWQDVDSRNVKERNGVANVYKCQPENEFLITRTLDVCKGKPAQRLVYKEAAFYYF